MKTEERINDCALYIRIAPLDKKDDETYKNRLLFNEETNEIVSQLRIN